MKTKRRFVAILMSLLLMTEVVCAGSITKSTKTSGGENGTIVIYHQIYKTQNSNSTPVLYTYGVKAYTSNAGGNTLKTNFTISGTLYTSSTHKDFNVKSGSATTQLSYTDTIPSATYYEYCHSKSVTSSNAFGSSTLEVNWNFQ